MKKAIAIIISISLCVAFAACSKNANETTIDIDSNDLSTTESASDKTTATISTQADTTINSTEESSSSTTEANETTEAASTTKSTTNADLSISVNEAIDYLCDFYGKGFSVNASVKDGNIQSFNVLDKKGNLYSKVKVNLDTARMTETIVDSGESNEYYMK